VLGGDPVKYRVPTKTATGNQNKHQASTNRPGGQQKPGAHRKEIWVPPKKPGAYQKSQRVPIKMPGNQKNAPCSTKEFTGAYQK